MMVAEDRKKNSQSLDFLQQSDKDKKMTKKERQMFIKKKKEER